MGCYTRFYFKATLSESLPEQVVQLLNAAIVERNVDENFPHGIDHDFFECANWDVLLSGSFSNGGDPIESKFIKIRKYWHIELNAALKNYDHEIEKFVLWILPWVVGRKHRLFLGYIRYEDCKDNFYIHLNRLVPENPRITEVTFTGKKGSWRLSYNILK